MTPRTALNRERVIDAAAAVADRSGLEGVSMRSVASALGVEAMSLYHHVANKEALLDGLADWVFGQIELPAIELEWREALRIRSHSARSVLVAHSWALGMLESRPAPGAPLLRHHDRMIGCLRHSGFSAALATHAFSVLDAYIYGFGLSESSLPFTPGDGAEAAFAADVAPSPEEYPHLTGALAELLADGSFEFADEFDYGLELILDGIARQHDG